MLSRPSLSTDFTQALGPFEYRMTPCARSIRLARHVLANWLELQPGVLVDKIDDLLIACSELATNACEHASGAEGSVAIRGRIESDAVVFEVEDDGGGFARPKARVLADVDDDDEHGRGLFIVDALTDRVEVVVDNGRTVVRCTKRAMLRQVETSEDEALSARFRSDVSS